MNVIYSYASRNAFNHFRLFHLTAYAGCASKLLESWSFIDVFLLGLLILTSTLIQTLKSVFLVFYTCPTIVYLRICLFSRSLSIGDKKKPSHVRIDGACEPRCCCWAEQPRPYIRCWILEKGQKTSWSNLHVLVPLCLKHYGLMSGDREATLITLI